MTAQYARWRLEGRALEHGFARTPGSAIRMKSEEGRWEVIYDKSIRCRMNDLADKVRCGMGAAGIQILGADCPCLMSAASTGLMRSVDLRVKVGALHGILEIKFSRSSLDAACKSAESSLPWMFRAARAPGYFLMNGRKYPMRLQLVGTLGVSCTGWRLCLQSIKTGVVAKRAQGEIDLVWHGAVKRKQKYQSGAAKRRKGGAAAKKTERVWRKSAKGKALKLKNMAEYWKSAKGKAARKRAALIR